MYDYDPKSGVFTFLLKGRDDYLAFTRSWKAEYRELSLRIRRLKGEVREAMRTPTSLSAGTKQGRLLVLQAQARLMLECRKQSKVWAQQSYLAAREAAQPRESVAA